MTRDPADKRQAVKAILDDFSVTVTNEDARDIVDLVRPLLTAPAGRPHPVDQKFHELAIKERNYERVKVDRLERELLEARRLSEGQWGDK